MRRNRKPFVCTYRTQENTPSTLNPIKSNKDILKSAANLQAKQPSSGIKGHQGMMLIMRRNQLWNGPKRCKARLLSGAFRRYFGTFLYIGINGFLCGLRFVLGSIRYSALKVTNSSQNAQKLVVSICKALFTVH